MSDIHHTVNTYYDRLYIGTYIDAKALLSESYFSLRFHRIDDGTLIFASTCILAYGMDCKSIFGAGFFMFGAMKRNLNKLQ